MFELPDRMGVILAVLICWTLLAVIRLGEALAFARGGQKAQPEMPAGQASQQAKAKRRIGKVSPRRVEPERSAGLGKTG